jgi:heme oxygenase
VSLIQKLRHETALAHERIERDLDIEARLVDVDRYRALVERLYGFHAPWEAAAGVAFADEGFFEERRKLGLLCRDLMTLGHSSESIARLPVCSSPPPTASRAEMFGALYVMEGSTLGGAVIARLVRRRLGFMAGGGCDYFSAYGPRLGAMWTAFRERLETVASPETDDHVVAAANRTFEAMRRWMTAPADIARRQESS